MLQTGCSGLGMSKRILPACFMVPEQGHQQIPSLLPPPTHLSLCLLFMCLFHPTFLIVVLHYPILEM